MYYHLHFIFTKPNGREMSPAQFFDHSVPIYKQVIDPNRMIAATAILVGIFLVILIRLWFRRKKAFLTVHDRLVEVVLREIL